MPESTSPESGASHSHGTPAKDRDIYLSFLVRMMELSERPIVLNSFAALGDASLFCCIFGISRL